MATINKKIPPLLSWSSFTGVLYVGKKRKKVAAKGGDARKRTSILKAGGRFLACDEEEKSFRFPKKKGRHAMSKESRIEAKKNDTGSVL